MSDFDSATSTPVHMMERETKARPSKRRRVYDDSEASSPLYSSADELGDPQPRRPSKLKDSISRRRPGSGSSDDGSSSPDHLTYRRNRSRSTNSNEDTPRSSSSHPSLSGPSPPAYKPLQLHYKQKFILRGHRKGVSQVRFSPDGCWIASCAADGTIKIWEAATGKHMRTLEGHLAGISTVAWSPDSNTLASGSDDKTIRLWDRASGKPYPAPLLGHHNYVFSLAFSPKGNMLVSGSYDEAVFLWDLRARRLMRSLPAHSDPVGGVDFIRDGTLVVSCSTDGLIRVWDTSTGQCLRTLVHEDNAPVTTVRFSPNGRYILAFTLDSCIRLWDYVSGSCKKTYQGHMNVKYSLGGAFGVGGTEGFIVSGSEDGDIVFWDVPSKEVVQRVSVHDGVVCWVDTCPVTGAVVSGGLDGTVRILVDVSQEEEGDVGGEMNGLKLEQKASEGYENGNVNVNDDDEDMDGVKLEPVNDEDRFNNDTPSLNGERSLEKVERRSPSMERMDED